MSNNEWPKTWTEIKDSSGESGLAYFSDTHMQYQEGIRGYQGTLYVSISIGEETDETADKWMPFNEYVNRVVDNVIDEDLNAHIKEQVNEALENNE